MENRDYPILELTPEEYDSIPRAEDRPKDFVKHCPIGTKFRCMGSTTFEDTVIGIVVEGKDALINQYGAGLSVPERFINRYKVRLV